MVFSSIFWYYFYSKYINILSKCNEYLEGKRTLLAKKYENIEH
jgi:hypothetical protein